MQVCVFASVHVHVRVYVCVCVALMTPSVLADSPGTPTGRSVGGTMDAEEASRLLAERRRLARIQKEQEERQRQEEERCVCLSSVCVSVCVCVSSSICFSSLALNLLRCSRLRAEEEQRRLQEARERQERAAREAEEERRSREEERKSREEEERRQKERRWKDMQEQLDREVRGHQQDVFFVCTYVCEVRWSHHLVMCFLSEGGGLLASPEGGREEEAGEGATAHSGGAGEAAEEEGVTNTHTHTHLQQPSSRWRSRPS